MIIGINCGHTVSGQPGCGAVGYLDESIETRNVGYALMEQFKAGGHTVINCTNDYAASVSENLSKIVSMANAKVLDLFISLHFNAGGGKGCEVYTYGGRSFLEAENVCRSISALGFKNRGIKDGSNLYVVRRTNAKAILIEVCFVDTAEDAALYKKIGHKAIARAIYEAVIGKVEGLAQYTKVNDIIWELGYRGIISDTRLWLKYCENDINIYYLCKKLCSYIRNKTARENEKNEYTSVSDIVWDLHHRGIISNMPLWEDMAKDNDNVYWLMRKGLNYIRTH